MAFVGLLDGHCSLEVEVCEFSLEFFEESLIGVDDGIDWLLFGEAFMEVADVLLRGQFWDVCGHDLNKRCIPPCE